MNTLIGSGVVDKAIAREAIEDDVDAARSARSATVRALQHLLEVLDGRRAAAHLSRWVAADVVEELSSRLRRPSPDASAEAGRLIRVHLQMHGRDCADYFGTLQRGTRVRAVAGRIVRAERPPAVPATGGRSRPSWTIVELTIV
ncbi:Rv3235 family protein [Gordonia hydrophobica]|uniref:Rv3235 family protein n=1 Tax=Gordonia hydrophobica TaxID=40516 RepID=UPI003556BB50|nr:hypothetical protein [Gordonia hydrophobica]